MLCKNLLRIWCIVIGVVAIIFAIIVFSADNANYEYSEEYGGDAYTGIQNAAAQTANNVDDLTEIVQLSFGAMLVIGGQCLIVFSISGFFKDREKEAHKREILERLYQCEDHLNRLSTGEEPAEVKVVETIWCPQCGQPNQKGQAYCMDCGTSLERKVLPDEWKCSRCGRVNKNYVGTCGCGNRRP